MSEWLDIMLGEIDRRREEDKEDAEESARRAQAGVAESAAAQEK